MKITVIGAGNSGLAMSAHLALAGHQVTLWNRTRKNIEKLMATRTIYSKGVVEGKAKIHLVTDNMKEALADPTIIFITTPANSHKGLAKQIAERIEKETLIILNPGRTFGALEFDQIYRKYNKDYKQEIAETQTIIYTCRKTAEDTVDVIALKSDVLLSTFDASENEAFISRLPTVLQEYLIPAQSMIETSLGNVGMILHCAPLLLNVARTENKKESYKYYHAGITPTISQFIEKIDQERVAASKALGLEVETTKAWLERTYHLEGDSLYELIHHNPSYATIDAPKTLNHRYIFEDIPCGLVPLEAVGKSLGLEMANTSLIINLANSLLNTDFRSTGRNLDSILKDKSETTIKRYFERRENR